MKTKAGFGAILKTSIPILVDLAAQIVMWTIEINFMGHIAASSLARIYPGVAAKGVDALTAVGDVIHIIVLTCTALLIFVFGATIIINKLIGSGQRHEANHFLGQALFTTMFTAVGISLAWYICAPFIFEVLLGASPAVTVIGVDYFRTLSLFAPFIIMNFVAIGIVRGAGDTHLSMITALFVNSIHLVLAFVLIFGIYRFPELGPRGSALAAGIAHTIGCFFTFSVILRGKSVLTFKWRDFTTIRRKSIGSVLRTGLPITLEQLAWVIGMTIVIGYSNRLGAAPAAAHMIILTIQRLFSILYQAFGIGALTLVGQLYGAEEHDHARKTTSMFFWLVGGVVFFLAAVTYLRSYYFVIVFTSEREVVEICTKALQVAALIQIPKALSYVYSFSLRGVGENRYPMYLAILGVLLFEVVFGYTLAFVAGLSIIGLWAAQGFDELFKMSFAIRRFRWRHRQLAG
jgi:putative MATE family efflux protein